MSTLTNSDLRFFDDNGYVVVKNAVSVSDCDAVIDAAFAFLEMDKNDPQDWYRLPLTPGGMIELYQHQALWNARQSPRIHGAMADLFRTENLWVSFDRVNVKPPPSPEHPNFDFPGFMHWDLDLTQRNEIPFGVQGVLYLVDTDKTMGGFQCAPGHHKKLDEWVAAHGTDSVVRGDARNEVTAVPIEANAGDFLIWNRRLMHGNGHNTSDKPRLAQFITMFPTPADKAARHSQAENRIRQWRDRIGPKAQWAPGDPRNWEQQHTQSAVLTPLGRKLLGADDW